MIKTYKFRLYPTKAQVAVFEQWLELCRELYNAALQERRDAWRLSRTSVNFFAQDKQLTEVRQIREDIGELNRHVCTNQLKRLDKAFKDFFRRVKNGEKAGFPRFKSHARFNSFTFSSEGVGLFGNKLLLSKIGKIKIKLHQEIKGKIKTITIKRECGKWFAFFAVECQANQLPKNDAQIGIDVGLKVFATLSDGREIENPRHFETGQKELRKAQRRVARRKKGSNRRLKAALLVQKAHQKIRNCRNDFQHKTSTKLVECYGLIAVERLQIKGLASGMFAKQIRDAAWGGFFQKLAYKAANAGRVFVEVDPNGTSQTCLCGASVPKTLSQRWHKCESCGMEGNRDYVSANLILQRAVRHTVQAITQGDSSNVA